MAGSGVEALQAASKECAAPAVGITTPQRLHMPSLELTGQLCADCSPPTRSQSRHEGACAMPLATAVADTLHPSVRPFAFLGHYVDRYRHTFSTHRKFTSSATQERTSPPTAAQTR